MSPASLRKADLIEMASELGLDFAASSRKDKIESVIRDHLLSHREDISRDKRFQLFSIPSRTSASRASGSGAKATAAATAQEEEAAESDGSSGSEDSAPQTLKGRVDAGVAHAKETLSLYQQRTHTAITSTFSSFQNQVSTVFATNLSLLLVEYAHLVYTSLPSSFFGTWHYGVFDALDSVKWDITYYTLLLVLVPLLVTFAINFTKMDSIRRKKHAYLVDPFLFGVTRFYIATLLFVTNYASLRRYAILAGGSGISSALIGVYASVLQTS